MTTDFYLKTGKWLFAVGLIGLGAVHLASGQMIQNFMLANWMPLKTEIAYLTGLALVAAGVLIAIAKYAVKGAWLAAGVFAIFLVFLIIPKLIMNLHDSAEYTFMSESFMFFSGALMLCGNMVIGEGNHAKGSMIAAIGRYIFALTLFDFGMEDLISEAFVVSIIPAWIPWKTFWAYFVMCAFFAASISLFFNIKAKLAMQLLCSMFFLFICLMHAPDVIGNSGMAATWTNFFVPIGVCGIALLAYCSVQPKAQAEKA